MAREGPKYVDILARKRPACFPVYPGERDLRHDPVPKRSHVNTASARSTEPKADTLSLIVLLLTAAGLAADAFAVSVGKGMHLHAFAWRPALALALTFGAFQAAMPVIGWALGSALAGTIVAFDHWVAFGLLAAIGAKMIWESRGVRDEGREPAPAIRLRELLILGIATSIDALAVGVSLAFLDVNLWTASVTIGIVTAGLSLLGVWLGHYAGRRLASCAELIGGLVLIGIGTNILIDHVTG